MHVQVITFGLRGISEDEYRATFDESLARTFAEMPGLMAKVWLANAERNAYGGVYLWETREAMEAYRRSEIFETLGSHPNLVDVRSDDYEPLEPHTSITSGILRATA